ncbi:DUF6153 family protein [Dactylosporangium sp. NPDC051484]|uniref:DUF6153 family protein n=1 Tax=Dactylosporangium sp. NPDC051484 TaxID=3154942 RepID=UPI00344C8975
MAYAVHGRLGRTARLALLLATLLGLTAMHTLGHHGPRSPGGDEHPATAAGPTGGSTAVPTAEHAAWAPLTAVLTVAGACSADGCGAPLAGPAGDHAGMSDWEVCLAVLVAFAVLLLAAALLHARRGTAAAAARARVTRRCGPRAPPPRPVGLTLAAVSVLRT